MKTGDQEKPCTGPQKEDRTVLKEHADEFFRQNYGEEDGLNTG